MGMISPLTPGQWNYIVYSFANGKFNAYSQGRLFHSGTINKAYLESKELIHIGNHKLTGGFFFGDIYEIRISQGIISEQEIAENWAGVLDRLK